MIWTTAHRGGRGLGSNNGLRQSSKIQGAEQALTSVTSPSIGVCFGIMRPKRSNDAVADFRMRWILSVSSAD